MKIDVQIFGKPIVKHGGPSGVCYIGGTNHWLEWLHHFLPGARRREKAWGRAVADLAFDTGGIRIIAGHSVGGTVACVAAVLYRYTLPEGKTVKLYTYGAKRPPRGYSAVGRHYRVRGDWVPFLPPWRPGLVVKGLDYGKMGPVQAHGPRSYYEQMKKDGVI